jgi:two-component system, chemotaxis family, chemotaxis protein CheY
MKTCLIVDDSRVIRKVARQIFEAMSFSCEEAENGQIALDLCKAKLPEFILLDWNMPVMNGMEFMLALRKLPNGAAPVVVFCTTENDIAHIQDAMTSGANEYIMKPFDADIIRGKLGQLGVIEA